MGSRNKTIWVASCLLALLLPACGGGSGGAKKGGKPRGDLRITTGTLPVCYDGKPYKARIRIAGARGAPSFRLLASGDALPLGLTFDRDRGRIMGAPAPGAGGAYFIEVEVEDEADPPNTVTRRFGLIVNEPRNEFRAIADWILPTCSASGCHSDVGRTGGLALDPPDEAHRQIVGILASNALAASRGKIRVVKGEPDESFLVQKLEGLLTAGEGDAMPPVGFILPEDQLDLIRRWIENGAWYDPQNEFPPDDGGGGPGGQVSVEIGRYEEQLYAPFKEGDGLVVLTGTQGGDWVLPSFRTRGLSGFGHLDISLSLVENGELVAALIATRPLRSAPGGEMELQNVLVPILVFDVDELIGKEAVFTIEISDSFGVETEASVRLNLTRQ